MDTGYLIAIVVLDYTNSIVFVPPYAGYGCTFVLCALQYIYGVCINRGHFLWCVAT